MEEMNNIKRAFDVFSAQADEMIKLMKERQAKEQEEEDE